MKIIVVNNNKVIDIKENLCDDCESEENLITEIPIYNNITNNFDCKVKIFGNNNFTFSEFEWFVISKGNELCLYNYTNDLCLNPNGWKILIPTDSPGSRNYITVPGLKQCVVDLVYIPDEKYYDETDNCIIDSCLVELLYARGNNRIIKFNIKKSTILLPPF